jgi:hypothetical protein
MGKEFGEELHSLPPLIPSLSCVQCRVFGFIYQIFDRNVMWILLKIPIFKQNEHFVKGYYWTYENHVVKKECDPCTFNEFALLKK